MTQRVPTAPAARSSAIDALRGWALAGIAVVNVPWIGFRESLPSMLASESTRAALPAHDLATALAVEGLCEGRFYPIFSALFGFGTGLLLDRGLAPYARRIAALFVFGVLHATFGWYGDVLLNYAAAGAVLALLARLPARALFAAAGGFFVLTMLASWRFDDWAGGSPSAEDLAEHARYVDAELRVYRDGTFWSISAHRWDELQGYFHATYNVSYRLNVLAMATLGMALERAGVHTQLDALRPRIGRLASLLVVVGLALSVALLVLPQLYIAAGDVLGMGYACAFLWLALKPNAERWTKPLAAVGRTALTCYLLQTACFTLFFYGYGLAMYGRIGPLDGVGLALGVYALELAFASAWMSRFEYGPMEWIWRAVTYLRWPATTTKR